MERAEDAYGKPSAPCLFLVMLWRNPAFLLHVLCALPSFFPEFFLIKWHIHSCWSTFPWTKTHQTFSTFLCPLHYSQVKPGDHIPRHPPSAPLRPSWSHPSFGSQDYFSSYKTGLLFLCLFLKQWQTGESFKNVNLLISFSSLELKSLHNVIWEQGQPSHVTSQTRAHWIQIKVGKSSRTI